MEMMSTIEELPGEAPTNGSSPAGSDGNSRPSTRQDRDQASPARLPSQGRPRMSRTPRPPSEGSRQDQDDGQVEVLITELKESDLDHITPPPETIPPPQRQTPPDDSCGEEEDWDTDLDVEDDVNPHDPSGRSLYARVCERLGVVPVSYFSRNITNPDVSMRYHGLGAQGTRAIAKVLKNNVTVERLNLAGNWMEGEGGQHIAKMLIENDYICEINLAENKLGAKGAGHIAKMLLVNTGLKKVDVTGNYFGDAEALLFAEVLEENKYLSDLLLSRNHFGEDAGAVLGPAIGANDVIEHLDLSWNFIRLRGAVSIARGLKENVRLKSCNLAWNGFGTIGGIALADAIACNESLTELDISGNRLDAHVALHIARALKKNEELKILKMGNNPINTSGAISLATAINESDVSQLELLDLTDIPVEFEYMKLVSEIQSRRSFTEIHGPAMRSGNTPEDIGKPALDPHARDPLLVLEEHILVRDTRILDLLRKYDTDDVMSVTQDDFAQALQELNVPYTRQQLDAIVAKLDRNGDGRIYYGDLLDLDRETSSNRPDAPIIDETTPRKSPTKSEEETNSNENPPESEREQPKVMVDRGQSPGDAQIQGYA